MAASNLNPFRELISGDDPDDVHEFVIRDLKAELEELRRYALITPQVFARCLKYLERHPEEFSPVVTGPLASYELVDYLLQVAS
jgi:hypothetical protein